MIHYFAIYIGIVCMQACVRACICEYLCVCILFCVTVSYGQWSGIFFVESFSKFGPKQTENINNNNSKIVTLVSTVCSHTICLLYALPLINNLPNIPFFIVFPLLLQWMLLYLCICLLAVVGADSGNGNGGGSNSIGAH